MRTGIVYNYWVTSSWLPYRECAGSRNCATAIFDEYEGIHPLRWDQAAWRS